MEREGSAKFLSALDSNKVKFLDLSRAGGSEVFRECLLFLDRGYLDMLNTLKLADLDIDDDDVEQLIQYVRIQLNFFFDLFASTYNSQLHNGYLFCRSLKKADQISRLDLSCNRKITLRSHTFLSELRDLKELNLAGCDLLTVSNKLVLPFCSVALSSEFNENIFKDAPYGLIIN